MRKYEPIWRTLKEKGICTLIAPTSTHTTIINMVKKEKRQDLSFKLLCAEKHTTYRLKIVSDSANQELTFRLVRSFKATIGNL